MSDTRAFLTRLLEHRLDPQGVEWLKTAVVEVQSGVDDVRFAGLVSMASRFARGQALAPTPEELAEAAALLDDWIPERWTCLEAARVVLVLARQDLAEDSFVTALEGAFEYADEGELCALYRSLAHLPDGERFVWRAGEGCRTNMTDVFEAVACDTPFPAKHFDEVAWKQLCIKAVFVGAPLCRVRGFEGRVSADLARMALDLADERRSAGRVVPPELWLCLGAVGGERGRESLVRELDPDNPKRAGRQAAAIALVRAGEQDLVRARLEAEADPEVAGVMRGALAGQTGQAAFSALDLG